MVLSIAGAALITVLAGAPPSLPDNMPALPVADVIPGDDYGAGPPPPYGPRGRSYSYEADEDAADVIRPPAPVPGPRRYARVPRYVEPGPDIEPGPGADPRWRYEEPPPRALRGPPPPYAEPAPSYGERHGYGERPPSYGERSSGYGERPGYGERSARVYSGPEGGPPACYWTQGERYWDGQRWTRARVQVCR
jgi:hypothetical protein